MVIDFSRVDINERPVLILKNTSGDPIGTLGAAANISVDIKYNEVSTLDFNLPAYTDGVEVPNYDGVIGMRLIDLQNIGQFILMNPKETNDGIKRTKSCKAYSLEYEFTFKKFSLENNTYNFWNPVAPSGTILGIILEMMPSWGVGYVDSSLIGKYRTYEVAEENLYNFIKNTLQQSYSCIFDFDTYNRVINVRDVSSTVPVNPVYISLENLAKEISIEEDTESIVTRLDVNGAEGVDIRDVNPTGNNKIINLDYYMTTDNFTQSIINKYNRWKGVYESYQLPYYNKSIEYSLEVMRKTTESAALVDLEGELTNLENQQAVIIRAIAENLDSQESLNNINASIVSKQAEINVKKQEISNIDLQLKSIMSELKAINNTTSFEKAFTEEEYIAIDRFIRDDAISEASFVVQDTASYSSPDFGNKISAQTLSVLASSVTSTSNISTKTVYEMRGGTLSLGTKVSATLIRGVLEKTTSGTYVATAYLGRGSINGTSFEKACLSVSGNCGSVSSTDSTLNVRNMNGFLYLTLNTSEYAKRQVAWDLYEYGSDILSKISQPAYKFGVTSANFLFIDEFINFKNSLRHGEKLYVGLQEGKVLAPIVIGLKYEYDSPQSLVLEFSDTYISGDSSFRLADLLEQSISMGKSVNVSKFNYSAFIDSGANTQVKEFMTSALDVAKNAIMSSKDQAISWGDSGIRLRKWSNAAKTAYDPHQVWMNNNSILMTKDNWSTAEIAIGNFYDKNLGNLWGVVAPNIVGTLLAGNNLVIESAKKDGGIAVFKMDADGCVIHNSILSVTSDAKNTHILLDSEHGIALGTYPLINPDGKINEDNYKFWVDEDGNLFFKGTLRATTGEFSGKVTATSGYIGGTEGWTIESTYIYNGKPSFTNTATGIYIGTDGISLGTSSNYIKLSTADGKIEANNVKLSGEINATSGYIGGCTISNGVLQIDSGNINSLNASKISGGTLNCGAITVSNFSADSISSGTLNCSKITVSNLKANSITSGTLDCNNLTVKNLRADSITVGKLSASQISGLPASHITSGQFSTSRIPYLSSDKIDTSTINASSGTIAGWTIGWDNSYGSYLLGNDGNGYKIRLSPIQFYVTDPSNYTFNVQWYYIYSAAASVQNSDSDINVKNSITDYDNKYDTFFDNLHPCKYKYNSGTSNRFHTGFIAQEIVESLEIAGLTTSDFAGVMHFQSPDPDGSEWALRRDEFVALNTWQIQKVKHRIEELENKIAFLIKNINL